MRGWRREKRLCQLPNRGVRGVEGGVKGGGKGVRGDIRRVVEGVEGV